VRDEETREVESGLQRLEAFSDAVMAVIITIMAFGLRPPSAPTGAALADRMPALLVYALSFAFLGIYWNNHHHLLRSATRLSGAVMWSNLFLLFWLSLIPVLTGWLATSYKSSLPAALYGGVALLAAVAYYILVRALIAANGRDSVLAQSVERDLKGLVSVVLYAAGVAGAFISPWIAYALYVGVSVIWVVPDPRLVRGRRS
jgi:TMEM175 potassium channel family protein